MRGNMFRRDQTSLSIDTLVSRGVENKWLEEDSPKGMAVRCLLDAIEYLRVVPKVQGRFWHVVNAHCIRLVHHCLSDPDLGQKKQVVRLGARIEQVCELIAKSRQKSPPFFGDDYWDWASVVDAFAEVRDVSPTAKTIFSDELDALFGSIKEKIDKNLTVEDPAREWFGPAIPALAHRVVESFVDHNSSLRAETLAKLKSQALETVKDGKYRGRTVPAKHLLWHYGQVVNRFAVDAEEQAAKLTEFSPQSDDGQEKAERVYVLARVIQGAYARKDSDAIRHALEALYGCQTINRPFGQGLVGETVKGSLNVLEALWPSLSGKDKSSIGTAVDALFDEYKKANTIGILVCIPIEGKAVEKEFARVGANYRKEGDATIVDHEEFRVVICKGKSIAEATLAARTIVEVHQANCVIMSGIAGSLGTSKKKGRKGVQFVGPKKGDVVIATSVAPYEIRAKVRETVENTRVPFQGSTWMTIPTDPHLFRLAHEAAEAEESWFGTFYEGLTVTGTGIKDNKKEKAKILKQFPGGLAVEEEGYMMGLVCMAFGVPCLNIRGISDLAQGDKKKQGKDKKKEQNEQKVAAQKAARLTVKVVQKLAEQL
jgi:nucleoside phosphorylase